MARKKRERTHSGKIDLPQAIVKLAEAIQILRFAHSSGQQSAELMDDVDRCCDEAIDLAGGEKDDEPDSTTDDSTSGSPGASGE